MIPQVKCWRIKVRPSWSERDGVALVWAPTKRLAILNTRAAGCWFPIVTLARWKEGDDGSTPVELFRWLKTPARALDWKGEPIA